MYSFSHRLRKAPWQTEDEVRHTGTKLKEMKMQYSEKMRLTVTLAHAAWKNLSASSSVLALLEHGKVIQDRIT